MLMFKMRQEARGILNVGDEINAFTLQMPALVKKSHVLHRRNERILLGIRRAGPHTCDGQMMLVGDTTYAAEEDIHFISFD